MNEIYLCLVCVLLCVRECVWGGGRVGCGLVKVRWGELWFRVGNLLLLFLGLLERGGDLENWVEFVFCC